MASARTGTEIISDALKLLGNETISDLGQVWLNNFLDRLYQDYRWAFQEASTTGSLTAGQSSVNLPSDFLDLWTKSSLKIRDEQGNYQSLFPLSADDFDQIIDPGLVGKPEHALIDMATLTWRPYPLPDVATYTWTLRYKKKPARITDFSQVITFPNDELLTQAVFVKGLQYEDDDRYVKESEVLELMLRRFRKGYNVSPGRNQKMRVQTTTFRTPLNFR